MLLTKQDFTFVNKTAREMKHLVQMHPEHTLRAGTRIRVIQYVPIHMFMCLAKTMKKVNKTICFFFFLNLTNLFYC